VPPSSDDGARLRPPRFGPVGGDLDSGSRTAPRQAPEWLSRGVLLGEIRFGARLGATALGPDPGGGSEVRRPRTMGRGSGRRVSARSEEISTRARERSEPGSRMALWWGSPRRDPFRSPARRDRGRLESGAGSEGRRPRAIGRGSARRVSARSEEIGPLRPRSVRGGLQNGSLVGCP